MRPVLVDPTRENLGLRERKKQRTRQRIAEVAHDLFVAHGFDNVTIADVADAADVSVKTVFNYFGTKEDLAFEGEDQVIAAWLNAIRHREPGRTPLDAVRALIEERFDDDAFARLDAMAGVVSSSLDLQSRLRLLWDRLEQGVALVLVSEDRRDAEPYDLFDIAVARVEAAGVVTVPRLFFSDEVRGYLADETDRPDALTRWLDQALAVLGLGPQHGADG